MTPRDNLFRSRLLCAGASLILLATILAIKNSRIFDTFDKENLIRSAFGADLTPYIVKEKTTYSDGCLQFHGITKSHPLFLLYFPEPYERNFHISFLHEEFNVSPSHNSIHLRRIGKSFDGYNPIIAYIPERKLLIFGYSNGIGG